MANDTAPTPEKSTISEKIAMFLLGELGLSIGAGISYLIVQDRMMETGIIVIFIGLSLFCLLASIFVE